MTTSFRLRSLLLSLLLQAATMNDNLPHTPSAGSAQRTAILDAARAPAQDDLGKPVRFRVDALNVLGDWAFLYAQMLGGDERPIDLSDTPLADAAAQGGQSRTYVALLRERDGRWQVQRHATGPTDAAWLGWSGEGAPEAVFQLPAD